MGLRKTGDWDKVAFLVKNLDREMRATAVMTLKRWALKTESIAKDHMSKQDLNWEELDPKTVARKVRKGYSENILIETSTYFQTITSWVDEGALVGYAGVKKKALSEDGEELADIAELHEFGSKSGHIPARPLWSPSMAESRKWYAASKIPETIMKQRIRKYMV
jgi:hypothetical protein